jgi:hypothetical protein
VSYFELVKYTDTGGPGRRFAHPDDLADRRHGGHHHHDHRSSGLHGGAFASAGAPADVPAPLLDAMKNLRGAVRLRLRQGPLDPTTANALATILDTVAQAVEANR